MAIEKGYVELQLKTVDTTDEYVDIEGWATVKVKDRDWEIVNPLGVDVTNFMKNPILLFNHKWDTPVGKALDVQATTEGVKVKCRIFKSLSDVVYNGVKNGVLNSFSIGFRGVEGQYISEEDVYVFTKTELYEISIVTIPANPEARFNVAKMACSDGLCLMSNKTFKKENDDMDLAEKLKSLEEKAKELEEKNKELSEKVAELESKNAELSEDNEKLKEESQATVEKEMSFDELSAEFIKSVENGDQEMVSIAMDVFGKFEKTLNDKIVEFLK